MKETENIKVGIAQTIAIKGNIEKNIENHLNFIESAIKKQIDLIIFPELSLTGYEPELSKELAINLSDKRLEILKQKSDENNITIIVGSPIRENENILIGAIIFSPNEITKVYTKYYLHEGEEKYFTPKESNIQLNIKGEKINIAICADISNFEHPKKASTENCSLYLASVLVSKKGLEFDRNLLAKYAKEFNLSVMMSNFGGISGGYDCAGFSSVWNNIGELKGEIDNNNEGLLIATKTNGNWKTVTI